MQKILLITFLFIAAGLIVKAQYCSQYSLTDRIKCDTLTDSSGNRFVVDKDRIYVTGYDSTFKQIWRTDPYKDNHIHEYRFERPTLVMFQLVTDEEEERIFIRYSNTQYGTLFKNTGKYELLGQD